MPELSRNASSRRRTFPPVSLAVAYWVAVVSPAVVLIARPGTLQFTTALSLFVALAVVMMIVMQFVSSGRFELLAGQTGLDVMMGFHRFAARALIAGVAVHVGVELWLSAGGEIAQLLPSARDVLGQRWLWSGVAATAIALLLYLAAIHRDRLGVKYELWRASHGLAATVLLGLTVHHAWTNGAFVHTPPVRAVFLTGLAVAIGALLVIYLYRGWKGLNGGWVVSRVRTLGPRLHELTLQMRPGSRFKFEAGQFVWVTFGRKHPLFDHPFSIASAPEELPSLRLVIKENGDFTDQVGTLPEGTQAFLDGPHGDLVVRGDPKSIVLIAGGVGMAPIVGLLESLARRNFLGWVSTVIATRDEAEQVFTSRLLQLSRKLDLRVLQTVENSSAGWVGHHGRVDREMLAKVLRETEGLPDQVLLCGPTAMMAEVTRCLVELGIPLQSIRYERFDYNESSDPKTNAVRRKFRAIFVAVWITLIGAAWAAS